MNKSKSRYFNTARRMNEALITLLQKKDFDYITIKEICDAAEVNRSTFYLHYDNISDLLAETIEYIAEKFNSSFDSNAAETANIIATGKLDELIFVTPDYLRPYLTFIKDNQKIFLATLKHPDVFQANTQYKKLYTQFFRPIFQRYALPENEHKYIIAFYMHGIMGIITEWVRSGCDTDISDISDIIIKNVLPTD